MNYEEAVRRLEKLTLENIRLQRRIEDLENQHRSTQRGRRTIINDEMIQKAQLLRDEGLPMRAIALELGVSSYTAHKILHMRDNASVCSPAP
jgi:hypothetical protein